MKVKIRNGITGLPSAPIDARSIEIEIGGKIYMISSPINADLRVDCLDQEIAIVPIGDKSIAIRGAR